MANQLPLREVLTAIDKKNRDYYKNLSPEDKKAFVPFVLNRYASSVRGSSDLQEWHLRSTNEYMNKNFFETAKYPELQWLLLTATSADMGNQYHEWIKPHSKTTDKTIKLLEQFYPSLNDQELQILKSQYTKADLKELARDHGWEEKDVKKIK